MIENNKDKDKDEMAAATDTATDGRVS